MRLQQHFPPNSLGGLPFCLKLEETVGCVDEINLQYLSGAIHRAKELKLDVVTLFFSMVADMGLDELTSYLKAQSVRRNYRIWDE